MKASHATRLAPLGMLAVALLALGTCPRAAAASDLGFVRGDANADGTVDVSDAVFTLQHLFLGEPCECLAAADFDGGGNLDISDPIALLNHLFLGGPPPKAPYPECGSPTAVAPDAGGLSCERPYCAVEELVREWVWYARADGCVQCVPCGAPSIEEVVRDLEDADIPVADSRVGYPFMVCMACEVCPSGRFYFVQVPAELSAELAARGWGRWEPGKPR